MNKSITRIAIGALLSTVVAQAAPFSGKGLPADAGAFVHLDLEAAVNSPIVKALREIGESAAVPSSDKAAYEKLKAELGINPEADLRDVTLVMASPQGAVKSPDAFAESVSVLVRGKFDRARMLEISKNHPEVKANRQGKHTWFSIAQLDKAFGGKASSANGKPADGCLCPVDNSTLLIAGDTKGLARALAALDSGSEYRADSAATKALAGSPILTGYFSPTFVSAMQPKPKAAAGAQGEEPASPELRSLAFSLAEAAGKLTLHADARLDSDQSATQVQAQAAMFQGFAQMGMSQNKPEASAQEKADKAFGLSVLRALKLAAAGDTFTVDFAYPSEKLATKLREKKGDISKAMNQRREAVAGAAADGAAE